MEESMTLPNFDNEVVHHNSHSVNALLVSLVLIVSASTLAVYVYLNKHKKIKSNENTNS